MNGQSLQPRDSRLEAAIERWWWPFAAAALLSTLFCPWSSRPASALALALGAVGVYGFARSRSRAQVERIISSYESFHIPDLVTTATPPPQGRLSYTGTLDRLASQLVETRDLVRETLDRYELITTNIAASVIIRDAEGEILFCSPYTQVLTGYSLDEVYSSRSDFLSGLVVEEDLERYRRAQQVSALAEDISVKYRIRHRTGIELWIETRLVPVCDIEGNLISVMGVSIDVSDTLNYQKQIEQQNRDLGDFAFMVSHDLKAPIFTIKGMAAALLEDYGETIGSDGCSLLNYIADATKRLETLVASVIEYSSVATKDLEAENVDLALVLQNVVADQSEAIRERKAKVTVESELPPVRGNHVRVYQVFSNLVGNALKYSDPSRPPEIAVRARLTPGAVVVEVSDNGLGIPDNKFEEIFRPYHRAHGTSVEGSGIGLACVKKIMDRLGGTVSVESRVNHGSTFRVTFPTPIAGSREVPADLARAFQ